MKKSPGSEPVRVENWKENDGLIFLILASHIWHPELCQPPSNRAQFHQCCSCHVGPVGGPFPTPLSAGSTAGLQTSSRCMSSGPHRRFVSLVLPAKAYPQSVTGVSPLRRDVPRSTLRQTLRADTDRGARRRALLRILPVRRRQWSHCDLSP